MKIGIKKRIAVFVLGHSGFFRGSLIGQCFFSMIKKVYGLTDVDIKEIPERYNAVVISGNPDLPFLYSECEFRGAPLPPNDANKVGRIL